MYYGEHMSTGGWVFMSIAIVILIVLLAMLLWWLVSQQRRTDGDSGRYRLSARETLDHRLVDGEITSEQYDELRTRLERAPRASA